MKVKTSQETVKYLIELLEGFDAETETFLDALPTPEKYAILSMAWVIHQGYNDFEEAHDEAMKKVSARDLTKYLIDYPFLNFHLMDALRCWRRQPDYFEVIWTTE